MAGAKLAELEEFLKKADQAHDLVNALKSEDSNVVKETQDKIDTILANDWEEEDKEYSTQDGFSKSCINKIEDNNNNNNNNDGGDVIGGFPDMPTDQAGFMRAVEEDAAKRHANRQRKEEKSTKRREKGNEAFKKGNYEDAIAEYDIAINLTGWNVNLYTNKAQCYIKLSQFDKAIEACDRALYIEDNFAKAYIQKSNALIALNELPAAVECLELCQKMAKDTGVVQRYLDKARTLLEISTDNASTMENVSPDTKKEFTHLLSKLDSDKAFEVTISAEFTLKSLESTSNIKLFRAMGGIETITKQLQNFQDHTLHIQLLNILKLVLSRDQLSLMVWIYSNPAPCLVLRAKDKQFRPLLLLLLQRLIFHDNDEIANLFLENWTDPQLANTFVGCFAEVETRAMTVLIVGRAIRHNSFLLRFKTDLLELIKKISSHICLVKDEEVKTWVSALSGLSMTAVARRLLDQDFWQNFLVLLGVASDERVREELLMTAQNMALDSVALSEHGKEITAALVELCGTAKCKRAPILLNKVLEKCPNALLAEDKGQFAALLKIIKNRTALDEDLSTAVKLLTRTTAVSVQARKWVLKYSILDCLVEILEKETLHKGSSKHEIAILSNAALCCAHCYQDAAVCKKRSERDVEIFLKHAKADKGSAIQQNAAIALARLATNSPELLEKLRDLRGLEVLHSRFSNPS